VPRPRSLTPEDIADAALAVIDSAGLAALSMRAVAAELGTGTMSLYRYVEHRAQLEHLVVTRVLDRVDDTPPAGVPWPDQVSALVHRIRDAVAAHPDIVPLFLVHRHSNAKVMACGEAILGILSGNGFAGDDLVIAFRTILAFMVGAFTTDRLSRLSDPGTAELAGAGDTYPRLAEFGAAAQRISPAVEFSRGLTTVLNGLSRSTVRSGAARTRPSRGSGVRR
jgi:AcrR family transcriptional regulator